MRERAGVEVSEKGNGTGITIKELFRGLDCRIIGGRLGNITRLTDDSRLVIPGTLFFAIEGSNCDGNLFIGEAIRRGAIAIVTHRPFNGFPDICRVLTDRVKEVMAMVAKRFYGSPDEALSLIGITGTNGKTTVSMIVQHLLTKNEGDVGLIGTVRYDLGKKRHIPSRRTTPNILEITSMLQQMALSKCPYAVMEVSSHGIDQGRISHLHFEVAVFLNLTPEHLDYHADMEEYYQVKKSLFTGVTGSKPRVAVINIDDVYGARLYNEIKDTLPVITISIGDKADFSAKDIEYSRTGSQFKLCCMGNEVPLMSSLIGEYNIYNILCALGVVWALTPETFIERIQRLEIFGGVPGRIQRVDTKEDFSILVDYAHKPDALRNVLQTLRKITKGKLIVVFGCGGNRDRYKRPKMTQVVQDFGDIGFATSDNPRKERIVDIFEDMKAGLTDASRIHFIENRREAIRQALMLAGTDDCVLIAGKGHEAYQEFADTIVPFDDCVVAREVLIEMKQVEDCI